MKLGNKGITKGAIAAISAGAVVVGGIVVAVLLNLDGKTAFRNITVIDTLGTVSVYRESVNDTLDAYVDMNLEAGDEVTVGPSSELDLKLDDDKFVYVEENTKMSLKAEGDSDNSRTRIFLSEGATLHKLDSKLSDSSTYEIETPNATMAIRGTITWAHVYKGADGEIHSDFQVYEGKTELQLHTVDGTPIGKTIDIPEGYQVLTRGGEDFSEIILQNVNNKKKELAPIDYKDLPTQTLKILKEIINSGRTIYIGVNTLPDRVPFSFDEVIEILKEREEDKTSEDEEEEDLTTNNKNADEGDDSEENAPDDEETEETTTSSTTKKKTTTSKNATTPLTTPTTTTPTVTTPSDTNTTNENPATYTVSFMYNGGTFAEQYVTYGMAASKPKLQPSASGNWYYTTDNGSLAVFDFSTPIIGNIILTWQ
ncbi:MAG: FecR domain-containing protein [Lachnospiraceae bacterium]|nr:FecR domain-containing protein [Lachnospiraceae bacterium]